MPFVSEVPFFKSNEQRPSTCAYQWSHFSRLGFFACALHRAAAVWLGRHIDVNRLRHMADKKTHSFMTSK